MLELPPDHTDPCRCHRWPVALPFSHWQRFWLIDSYIYSKNTISFCLQILFFIWLATFSNHTFYFYWDFVEQILEAFRWWKTTWKNYGRLHFYETGWIFEPNWKAIRVEDKWEGEWSFNADFWRVLHLLVLWGYFGIELTMKFLKLILN